MTSIKWRPKHWHELDLQHICMLENPVQTPISLNERVTKSQHMEYHVHFVQRGREIELIWAGRNREWDLGVARDGSSWFS